MQRKLVLFIVNCFEEDNLKILFQFRSFYVMRDCHDYLYQSFEFPSAKWPIRPAALISGSAARIGSGKEYFEWDAGPSQGFPKILNLGVSIYTPGWREE